MKLPASELTTKYLAPLDQVHERGESITVTKRSKVVARVVPAVLDRILVATSRVTRTPMLTKDRRITKIAVGSALEAVAIRKFARKSV